MITYLKGTVFNTPAKTIVNTVNCSGVMGAGIALEFKLRFPDMFKNYEEKCKNKEIKIGRPSIYEYTENLWIMNFPTKGHWRFPSKIQWIEQGLKYFAENYKKRNIESIAFPKLGTSNGGLNWDEVKNVMEKYLRDLDLAIYICLDETSEADGVEKDMINILNTLTLAEFIDEIKVQKKQAEIIMANMPIKRIWHVSKFEGIGEKTYEKLFKYLYSSNNHEVHNEYEQLTFL